jgi:hypothetical protein
MDVENEMDEEFVYTSARVMLKMDASQAKHARALFEKEV